MPSIPQTDIQLAQAALIDCGLAPISSFNDDSDEALALNRFFETVVADCLTQRPWHFARTLQVLSRDDVTTRRPWTATYHLPTDPKPLRLRSLDVDGKAIDYEQTEAGLLCKAQDTDEVVLIYSFRQQVSLWPPMFTNYVQLKLASRVAASIASDPKRVEAFNSLAEDALLRMGPVDAQGGGTVQRISRGRMLAVRRGAR